MQSTPRTTSTHASPSSEATKVTRDLIASFGQDPDLYVPGTVAVLPRSRTVTWEVACSPRCPHPDRRCHRSHAAYVDDDPTRALLARHSGGSGAGPAARRAMVPPQRQARRG